MTAINFVVLRDRAIAITDAAVYALDGTITGWATKAVPMTSLNCVLAASGIDGGTVVIAQAIEREVETFDELAAGFSEIIPAAVDRCEALLGSRPGEVFVAGYSTVRNRAELCVYSERSTRRDGGAVHREPGVVNSFAGDFQMVNVPNIPVESFFMAWENPPLAAGQFTDPADFARRLIALQREQRFEGVHIDWPYLVGGHVQMTTVSASGISAEIVHRFDDRVGQRIQPAPVDWSAWRAESKQQDDPASNVVGLSRLRSGTLQQGKHERNLENDFD